MPTDTFSEPTRYCLQTRDGHALTKKINLKTQRNPIPIRVTRSIKRKIDLRAMQTSVDDVYVAASYTERFNKRLN